MAKKEKGKDQMSIEGTEEIEILGRLTERIDKAVDLIRVLRKENDSLKSQLEEKSGDLGSIEDAKKEADEEIASLTAKIVELESGDNAKAEKIEGELEKLKGERSVIRKKVESALEKLESLEN